MINMEDSYKHAHKFASPEPKGHRPQTSHPSWRRRAKTNKNQKKEIMHDTINVQSESRKSAEPKKRGGI